MLYLDGEDKDASVQYALTATVETVLRTTQYLGCLKCSSSSTSVSKKVCAVLCICVCKILWWFHAHDDSCLSHQPGQLLKFRGEIKDIIVFYRIPGGQMK